MLTSLPNLLTLSRIAMIPVVLALMFFDTVLSTWAALIVFALAGLTDYLDGRLARQMDQVSAFGKFLDPIADKLMVIVVLFALVALDRLENFWVIPVIIIVVRELLVSGLREFLGPYNVEVPVTRLAKWKTFIQMLMIGFAIMGPYGEAVVPYSQDIGRYGITIAAVLTVVTGWNYLTVGFQHIQTLDGKTPD